MKAQWKCGKGHELQHITKEEFGSYICNICYQCSANSEGKLHCQPCDYDVCYRCGSLPRLGPASVQSPKCPKGHRMEFTTSDGGMDGYSTNQRYKCDKCLSRGYLATGRWWCSICCYDLCHTCLSPPPDGVLPDSSDDDQDPPN